MTKKPTPIKPHYPLRMEDEPESMQAVAEYMALMKRQHVKVSINGSICTLIIRGWQAVQAEAAAQKAAQS